MRGFRRVRCFGRIVAILALLWATAGTAQRVAPPVDPALAAFLAMGGTLADLCGAGHEPADHPRCDFCRHVGPALPAAGFAGLVRLRPPVAWASWREVAAVAMPGLRAGPGLRGPPAGFV